MLKFTVGNILEADAECLVNTVNCEGYMGKGIAYQFKKQFPHNNSEYVKACRNGSLTIGKIHYFQEKDKLIINFPTKDKWREKSKIEYINRGLSDLVRLIPSLNIKSLAIPPLGCGNGGLNWLEVKPIIINYLNPLSNSIDVSIYEPSRNFNSKASKAPKLNASHLILMTCKLRLSKFNRLRIQKTAYFINLFSGKDYFRFVKHKYGPYAHSIDILTRDIKEFQGFYNIETSEALELAQTIATSKSVDRKLNEFSNSIEKSTNFVNEIATDKELELLSTICAVLGDGESLSSQKIVQEIASWSEAKASKFSEAEIIQSLEVLVEKHLIDVNLIGYSLSKQKIPQTTK